MRDPSEQLVKRAIVVLERSARLGALASGHSQRAERALTGIMHAVPTGGTEDG